MKKTIGILLVMGGVASAAVPREFTVQGILRNNAGMLQSLTTNVIVTLYDDETAGTMVAGPYTATNVPVNNGLFTVRIQDAQIATKIAPATEVWVQLSVGSDNFPRTKMSTQPMALLASSAESADALSSKCSGCVTDAMIGGIAASKVSGKVASAAACDSATSANSATSATSATSCTTATNATQLGGTAAASFQAVLNSNCGAGKYIQNISSTGVVGCGTDAGGSVTSVGTTSAALSIANPTTTPSIALDGSKVTNISGSNISAGTIPNSAMAILPGAKTVTGPTSGQPFFFPSGTSPALTLNTTVPGAGVMVVTATGYLVAVCHNNGTTDEIHVCLAPSASACASVSNNIRYVIPSGQPSFCSYVFPISITTSFPVSASGSFSATLFGQLIAGNPNNAYILDSTMTAIYVPGTLP